MKFPDNSIYEGNFSCNKIEGTGHLIFSDGRTYLGEWENNKMHGKGKLT
jgi:hypothetical protein